MEGFEVFCGGTFWNETLVFNGTWPQFTDCFMHTALIWVPCGFLWLLLPMYIASVHRNASRIPHRMTCVNMTRLFCCILLTLLSLVTVILRADGKASSSSLAAFLGDGIFIATYIVVAALSQYERLKGAQPPGVAFFFWLLSSVCTVIPFYTMLIEKSYEKDLLSFAVLTLTFVLRLVALLMTGFNDSGDESGYKHLGPTPCPETTCSFPSYLFYWWMTRLVIKGYKKDLEETDLWNLPPQDQTTTQVPRFEQRWKEEQRRCAVINSKRQRQRRKRGAASNKVDLTSVEPVANGISEAANTATEASALLNQHTAGPLYSSTHTPSDVKDRKYPSLLWVVIKQFGPDFLVAFVQKTISDLVLLLSPLLLGALMDFLGERHVGRDWQAYTISLGMFLTILIKSLFFAHSMFRSSRIGIQIKSTCVTAVYKKALTMNNAARNASTAGEIVNLMSVDAQRLQDLLNIFFFAMTTPLQVAVGVVLLYLTIGPSIIVGVILLACLIPLNAYVAARQRTLQNDCLKFKDNRIRLFNEILNGIKVLKLYAWEPSFREKIRAVRIKEVGILLQLAILNTLMSLSWDMAPYLVTLATFATYVLADRNNYLDAGKAFVSLSLFNLLRAPLNLISSMIMYTIQAQVSIKRINKFLVADDLDPHAVTRDDSAEKPIAIKHGTFTWDRNFGPSLVNIDLEMNDGRLIAVVGPVGCGKSSLISAMLGEMEVLKGSVTTRGRMAYVPQQAWIQNATLRDNVLFGKPFDRSKYKLVLEACELERDLTILSAGDMTEIGEKGINLSGGQKQRVSLARAVYSDSDVYLFDDPLSAVDSHVGKAIFRKVVGPTGILRGKTRVLVTHGVHWLPMVDEIIVMQDGKISERGSYEALLSHNGAFAQFLKTFLTEVGDDSDVDGGDDPQFREILEHMREKVENVTSDGASSAEELYDVRRRRRSRRRTRSEAEERKDSRKSSRLEIDESTAMSIVQNKEAEITGDVIGKLTTVETMEKGKVKKEVFGVYGRAAGLFVMSVAFLSFCVFQAFSVATNFWLNDWTADPELLNASVTSDLQRLQHGNDFYLGVYGVLGIFQAIFLLVFNYLYWTRMAEAARTLHARFADRIVRAPMSFFDTTPIGRILNRASRDVETVDNNLPMIVRDFLVTFAMVALTLVVVMIQTPMSGLILLPLVVVYYFVQSFYVPTARQLKRIEAVTRSPVYTLFSETLSGAASIRAYNVSNRFEKECMRRVDHNQVFFFAFQGAVRWLQWNLDILAGLVVFASALFAVIATDKGSGDAGLSVSYALQVSGTLTWMTRQICEFETNIVSVERLKEYSELDKEAEWILPDKRPAPSWPEKGEVIFENYQTRYRPGLDLVLKGVNCSIKHGEKVGIVGRTGAGKSSLTLALFRLIEAAGGAIWIDNVNIAGMGLHDLRHKLTILPQDPVLFSGTLRMNLDPFDEYDDEQLWTALARAHLKHAVSQMSGGLQYEVGEEGANLSVGQRQLVCLARTLLRRTQILVLDEATAAVDMETDSLIQNTIRSAFSTCTVITIAHRLNTIMDYDRIMVMDAGVVREFSTPSELLANKTSIFYGMAKDAGLV